MWKNQLPNGGIILQYIGYVFPRYVARIMVPRGLFNPLENQDKEGWWPRDMDELTLSSYNIE